MATDTESKRSKEKAIQERFNRAMGRRINAAQAKGNISAKQLADAVGCSITEISMYKNGLRTMNAYRLHLIAAALGVTASELTGEV